MHGGGSMDSQLAINNGSETERNYQIENVFMSAHGSVRTQGVFEFIDTPVSPSGSGDEYFHRQIAEAMNRARAQGISNPIVVGAIPFDLTQPSALMVPRRYEMFSRRLEAKKGVDEKIKINAASKVDTTEVEGCLRAVHMFSTPAEMRFKQGVNQAIANFRLSDIRKAVLSRILKIDLSDVVDTDTIFGRLVEQNADAFHFRLQLQDGSELLGASPELLVRKQGPKIVLNPLAGSARRQSDADADASVSAALMNSAKDLYEHRLVVEELREQLTPLCCSLSIPDSPSLLSTRAMWHLSTVINGEVADASLSALMLAARLHPTPAVCGYPRRQAHKLINLVEPFNRDFFAGVVGWCDSAGNGEWAVTIRCGRFKGRCVELFAGAGIVEESCPDAEWAETEAKLQTMLSALGIATQVAMDQVPPESSVEAASTHPAGVKNCKDSLEEREGPCESGALT